MDHSCKDLCHSRQGRIVQLKAQISQSVKDTKSLTEFLHGTKANIDFLTLFNIPVDAKFLSLKILNVLNRTKKKIYHYIQARDSSITFDELNENKHKFE